MNKVEFYPIVYENNKLYVHIRKTPSENGVYKKYFGITKLKLQYRWGEEGKGYSRKNKRREHIYFYKAILKHGWDEGFNHILILKNLTRKEAEELEKYFIKYYKTNDKNFGYNLTKGGDGAIPNKEVCQKMSESRKGEKHWNYGKHWNKEVKDKMSKSHKGLHVGKKNPMYGKHHTEETRKKISKINLGKKKPKISEFAKTRIGNKNSFYGKHHTEETRSHLSEIKSIKVIRLSDNKVYKNSIVCGEDNNLSSTAIQNHCKNKVLNPQFAYYKEVDK